MDNVMSEVEVELQQAKLHEANLQMQRTLQSMPAFSAMDPRATCNIVSSVTNALRRVREAGLSHPNERQSSQEEILYWSNLKKLKKALPTLHVQLKMKRASLDRSLSHRKSVTRWVEVSKEIL